ncbi:MAG: DUF5658 family protein [Planctomycetota bacterium]
MHQEKPPHAEIPTPSHQRGLFRRHVLFPDVYAWFILLASLDIMLTWVILWAGGSELNVLADWIIQRFNLPGVVAYKFILVLLVVFICEIVGRHNYHRAIRLARWAVVLTAFPVVVAVIHLARAFLV